MPVPLNIPAVVVKATRQNLIGKKIIILNTDMSTKKFKFVWVDADMKEQFGFINTANRENFEYLTKIKS